MMLHCFYHREASTVRIKQEPRGASVGEGRQSLEGHDFKETAVPFSFLLALFVLVSALPVLRCRVRPRGDHCFEPLCRQNIILVPLVTHV